MTIARTIIASIAIALFCAACYSPQSSSRSPTPAKVEATAAANDDAANTSPVSYTEPLTLAPDVAQVSAVAQPAHDPPPAPARVFYAPAVPSGHLERYGLFGRKTRWVTNQPQQTFGGCAGGNCGGRR